MSGGLLSQLQGLKVRVSDVGFKPLAPQGQAPRLESPPQLWGAAGGGARGELSPASPARTRCLHGPRAALQFPQKKRFYVRQRVWGDCGSRGLRI